MRKPEFIKLKRPAKKENGSNEDGVVRDKKYGRSKEGGDNCNSKGKSNNTDKEILNNKRIKLENMANNLNKQSNDKNISASNNKRKNRNKNKDMDISKDINKDMRSRNVSNEKNNRNDRNEKNNRNDRNEKNSRNNRNEKKSRNDSNNDITTKRTNSRRSEPNIEYVLDDATAEERELIYKGTISDRVNTLTLLCARNPSADNYKQLLFFVENQRNDVIYHVLKNLRDLLRENVIDEPYIRGRIIKCFERGVKNPYVKNKVLDIVTVLTRAGIYSEDFLSIIVERLMEKGETLTIVENSIRSLFLKYEGTIMANIEDFYYKNDSFRVQYLILRFLSTIDFVISTDVFDFYNGALSTLDNEYAADQRALMLDLIINGLSKSVSGDSVIERIDLIRSYQGSPQVVLSALRLLVKIKDSYVESYVLKTLRSLILRKTKQEPELLNVVSGLENKDLIGKLVNSCFYYSVEFIISTMILAAEKGVNLSQLYSLTVFTRHYHPAVRDSAVRLQRGEVLTPYDPYDSVILEGVTSRLY
ncbi:hypothetical protein PAEPH01_1203 [Pancytospora epiphaga]|nr:hypothetical protein PAEPH01_1203 [Pancytospora epiphaga]